MVTERPRCVKGLVLREVANLLTKEAEWSLRSSSMKYWSLQVKVSESKNTGTMLIFNLLSDLLN